MRHAGLAAVLARRAGRANFLAADIAWRAELRPASSLALARNDQGGPQRSRSRGQRGRARRADPFRDRNQRPADRRVARQLAFVAIPARRRGLRRLRRAAAAQFSVSPGRHADVPRLLHFQTGSAALSTGQPRLHADPRGPGDRARRRLRAADIARSKHLRPGVPRHPETLRAEGARTAPVHVRALRQSRAARRHDPRRALRRGRSGSISRTGAGTEYPGARPRGLPAFLTIEGRPAYAASDSGLATPSSASIASRFSFILRRARTVARKSASLIWSRMTFSVSLTLMRISLMRAWLFLVRKTRLTRRSSSSGRRETNPVFSSRSIRPPSATLPKSNSSASATCDIPSARERNASTHHCDRVTPSGFSTRSTILRRNRETSWTRNPNLSSQFKSCAICRPSIASASRVCGSDRHAALAAETRQYGSRVNYKQAALSVRWRTGFMVSSTGIAAFRIDLFRT